MKGAIDNERRLLSRLSQQGEQCVPGLPSIPIWDIHRSELGSMNLDAQKFSVPLFQSMLSPSLYPFHCILVEDTVPAVIPRVAQEVPSLAQGDESPLTW